MGGYFVVCLAAKYHLNKHFDLTLRVDNLFDRDYEEVKYYGTPGISAYGGIKVKW
jgi:vitamin B12 transporter